MISALASTYPFNEAEFAALHFGACDLGDARRTKRLVTFAAAAARQPGESIPELCQGRSAGFNAIYDLLKNEASTPGALQGAHTELVAREIAARAGRTVLVIDDGTEISWPGNRPVEGLGPISNAKEGLQGFHVHTSLAAVWPINDPLEGRRPPLELLGLAAQIYYVRPPKPKRAAKPKGAARKKKVRGGPEGQLWRQAGERIGPAPEGVHLVRVCDRGAGIFEFLQSCRELNHDFIVRACQNRRLAGAGPDGKTLYLFDEIRRQAPLEGSFEIELRARPGQPARTARLRTAVLRVALEVPAYIAAKRPDLKPMEVCAVRVFEADCPEGVEPLEWILLCGHEVSTFEEAAGAARMYASRWLIEEYHKGLKTGMKVEDLQLEHGRRLIAAVSILAIVTLRLLTLREIARACPEAPAARAGMEKDEIMRPRN